MPGIANEYDKGIMHASPRSQPLTADGNDCFEAGLTKQFLMNAMLRTR